MRRIIPIFIVMGIMAALCAPSGAGPLMWGFALDGYPVTQAKLKAIESSTALRSDMIVFFLQWPSPQDLSSGEFPLESLEAISANGALPCITWEPMYIKDGKEVAIPFRTLLDGGYDPYLVRFAQGAKSWNKPLLIRFAHEMNLKRYHWGTTEEEYGPDSPIIYRKMYRYVVDLFRRCGAENVLWVFCPNSEAVPNASCDPSASWNTLSGYYPGNGYVDILGVDGYNWGTTRKKETHGWESRWQSFGEIFERPCAELKTLGSSGARKPLIVFETSTVGAGGDKTQWIRNAVATSRRLGIDGIVWFQSHKELDWRMESGSDRSYLSAVEQERVPPQDWTKWFTNQKER